MLSASPTLTLGARSTAFHTSSEPVENPLLRQVLDCIGVLVERTSAGTWLTADIGRAVLMDTNARRTALDRVAPCHPVMLTSFTGHAAILNSAALRALDIPDDARDPVGGWYERDSLHRLNGVLQAYAVWNAQRRRLTALPDSVRLEDLRKYSEATLRYGITSVQDMANDYAAATTVRLFHDAELPFRVRIIRMPMTDASGRLVSEWASVDIHPASLTTVNGWKWILEGTGVERTALKRTAYPGFPGQYGRLDGREWRRWRAVPLTSDVTVIPTALSKEHGHKGRFKRCTRSNPSPWTWPAVSSAVSRTPL